jgi:hypothetical protein
MATNLGSAYVTVNAVTTGFAQQLRKGIDGASKDSDAAGQRVGKNFSNSFSRGFGGGGRFTMFGPNFFKEADAARARFQTLLRTGYVLGPLLTSLGGAVGALGSALFVVGGAAAVASQSLIVLPAALVALAQAAVVAKVAMMGVGNAIKLGLKPAKSGAAESKALENALERLQDARIRLARAEEDRAETVADANKKIVKAEEDYIDAQYDSEKAAKALSKAREEAAEDLQQLRFETEEAAISEGKARLAFERSRESLQRVQDLPPNSRARREAELAFAEADLNLRRSIDRNSDVKKAEKEATAAGVEGSDKVLNASEKLSNAKRREAEAYEAVGEAVESAARAQRDANRRVADAERDLARAKEDVADASKKAKTGVDQFGEAMKRLSPEAQDFVKYIISIKDEFQELRAAAGQELFPKLIVAIDNLVKNLLPSLIPLFRDTGSVLGDIAIGLSETVAKGENVSRLERVWKTNDKLLGNFGKAASNLYEVFLILLDAAEPLITRFGEWIETLTTGWRETLNAEGATEKLRGKFERAGDVAAAIGRIFSNTFGGLSGLIGAINKPGGAIDVLLEKLEAITLRFKEFAQAPENAEGINTFFTNSVENAGKLLTIIGNILGAFGEIGASEDFGSFLDDINNAVLNIRDAANIFTEGGGLAAFGKLIEEFSITIKAFTEAGSITVFFGVLTEILEFVNKFATSDAGKKIITTVAPVLAFFSAIGFAFKIAKFFFMAMVGSLGSILKVVSTFSRILMLAFTKPAVLLRFLKIALAPLMKLLGPIVTLVKFLAAGLVKVGIAMWGALGPWLLVIIAIVALGILIYKFRTQIAEFVEKIIGYFKDLYNRLVGNSIIPDMVKGIIDWIKGLWDKFTTMVREGIDKVVAFFKELPGKVLTAVGNFATSVLEFIQKYHPIAILIRYAKEKWPEISQWFTDKITSIVDWFRALPDRISTAARGMFDGLKEAFRSGINWIIRKWNDLRFDLRLPTEIFGIKLPSAIAGRGFTLETPDIRELAEGGTISPSLGGTLVKVAEAGQAERIEPLDPDGLSKRDKAMINMLSGGGGTTINVYPSPGMDERQLAEMVSRKLAFQMRKGGI